MKLRRSLLLFAPFLAIACSAAVDPNDGQSSDQGLNTAGYNDLNLTAGSAILYEVQVRAANACDPDVGSEQQRAACRNKASPTISYRAEGMSCGMVNDLQKLKLGTLDDMMEPTTDYRQGITLAYIKDKVGANMLWLMPLFPNNDQWSIPDACDNLGSPYAVRDYMHAAGTLSRACIAQRRDEYSGTPCWANPELDGLVQQAHSRGQKVMLDLALNHFGHNYLMYDYGDYTPVRERTARNEDLGRLWDFAASYEENLLRPDVLDTAAKLSAAAGRSSYHRDTLRGLRTKCPNLQGDDLVRGYNVWREAFDWERQNFDCGNTALEVGAPGFYLGRDHWAPASRIGDNFTNNWRDVKFLYHQEGNTSHGWEFAREREYLFRIMNYWVSRGVDGFRLDHTTDPDGGMGSNEWKYLTSKVDYYAYRRGQQKPIFLAEEFGDQMEMNKVVDVMTEGYVGDMCGRNGKTKDTWHVENVINNMGRFNGHAFVMTALETHDEHRLTDGTGFNLWTGAGFWGIGAAQRATPMILMGQEFGESYGLGFRRSDYLRARFVGSPNYRDADALVGYYKTFSSARLANENRALLSPNYSFLRSRHTGQPDTRILAQAKWSDDGNVMFVFHNLWEQDVTQSYAIEPWLASAIHLDDGRNYRLVDAISSTQQGTCRRGSTLKSDFYVHMDPATRAQWLRLEVCQ